ncbi:MAG: MBL fold metallo-hydrolase [Candidatus Doudnabacteria bacterium]
MNIKQFPYPSLSLYSYAITNGELAILVDPPRNPEALLEYTNSLGLKVIAVIETHSHADFVSGHLQVAEETDAVIYVGPNYEAKFPHTEVRSGYRIEMADGSLEFLETPGHSWDSVCVLVKNPRDKITAILTGDTIFVGDVGRPDLRPGSQGYQEARLDLARAMYYTVTEKLRSVPNEATLYPAHGAGTLCGKNLSSESSSTMGKERLENPALQPMSEEKFITYLISDQPQIPPYFNYDVETNKLGACSISHIPKISPEEQNFDDHTIIDARNGKLFSEGHLDSAINIQNGKGFETWLGTIIKPKESFNLVVANPAEYREVAGRLAMIGYERQVRAIRIQEQFKENSAVAIPEKEFREHPEHFTILDLRSAEEVRKKATFFSAINIPLDDLQKRWQELPIDKPIIVHCAGGYRSAIGSSLLRTHQPDLPVYDLSNQIINYWDKTKLQN